MCKEVKKSGILGLVYISVFPVSVVQYEELAVGYVCVMGGDVVISVGLVVKLVRYVKVGQE